MYDPNDIHQNHFENGSELSGKGSETAFTKSDIPEPPYADANFTPRSEEPSMPHYYRPTSPEKPKKERKKSGFSAAKVVALCLVCALIGGFGGAAVGSLDLFDVSPSAEESGTLSEPPTPTPVPTPTSTPMLTSSAVSGDVMSAGDIYTLACQQSVGVTTEITYTNYFGQTSATAVSGSGFVVTSDGYILTNYHVIEDAYEGGYDVSVMLYNGESYTAEIVGFEKDNDVALLKIDASELTPVTIGDSDGIRVGDTVYAVGNPLGELSYTMTTGSVSALDRAISTDSSGTTINMFQLDAAVNGGNSGGPVYNDKGEVIGIVTAKYEDTGVEGLGFAIPINDAIYIANELISNGYVSGKAFFGIVPVTVSESAARYYNMVVGACVYSINEGSCAEKAGLLIGDIIVKLGDTEIASREDLDTAKKDYRAGDTATLTVYRSGEYIELTITFDEYIPEEESSESQEHETEDNQESGTQTPALPFGW